MSKKTFWDKFFDDRLPKIALFLAITTLFIAVATTVFGLVIGEVDAARFFNMFEGGFSFWSYVIMGLIFSGMYVGLYEVFTKDTKKKRIDTLRGVLFIGTLVWPYMLAAEITSLITIAITKKKTLEEHYTSKEDNESTGDNTN